jgi:hypothetical protein
MMSLLSNRKINRAVFLSLFAMVVLLFLALPVPSSLQSPESVIGPSVAWAGSPDETLNPPHDPPKRCAKLNSTGNAPSTDHTLSGGMIWRRILISALWRTYWVTLRF